MCPNCVSSEIDKELDRFRDVYVCACNNCDHTWEEDNE